MSFVKSEIIVCFHNDVGLARIKKMIAEFGLSIKTVLFKKTCLVAVSAGSERKWVKKFSKSALVRFANLNYYTPNQNPEDPNK